jgi:hypothetical protein
MDALEAPIGDGDRQLLHAHYGFYRALETGSRQPTTPAQRHYIAVCRGFAAPETDHEWAYLRFKRACKVANVEEEIAAATGFIMLMPGSRGTDGDGGELLDVPVRACAGCGQPIPPQRLNVVPEATRCVGCQRQADVAPRDWRVSEIFCPRCSTRGFVSRMVWRSARDPKIPGYFMGCSRYPECQYVDRS